MAVKRTGDFKKALNFFENLNQNLIKAEKKILTNVAAKAEKLAVDRINSQPSEWKKLSPAYLKAKLGVSTGGRIRKDGKKDRRFKNRSEKILISSSTYLNSITSGTVSLVAYAGVTKTARYENGESVAKIARVHEYGSTKMNIPARPVWQVVHRQMISYIVFSNDIPNALKEALLRGM